MEQILTILVIFGIPEGLGQKGFNHKATDYGVYPSNTGACMC